MRISRRVLVGVVPALVIAAGVLAGNALLYHDTTLAPYARLHDSNTSAIASPVRAPP